MQGSGDRQDRLRQSAEARLVGLHEFRFAPGRCGAGASGPGVGRARPGRAAGAARRRAGPDRPARRGERCRRRARCRGCGVGRWSSGRLADGLRRPRLSRGRAHRPTGGGRVRRPCRATGGGRRRAGRRRQRRPVLLGGRFRGPRDPGLHPGRPCAQRPPPGAPLQRGATPEIAGGDGGTVRRPARSARQHGGSGQALQLGDRTRYALPAATPHRRGRDLGVPAGAARPGRAAAPPRRVGRG